MKMANTAQTQKALWLKFCSRAHAYHRDTASVCGKIPPGVKSYVHIVSMTIRRDSLFLKEPSQSGNSTMANRTAGKLVSTCAFNVLSSVNTGQQAKPGSLHTLPSGVYGLSNHYHLRTQVLSSLLVYNASTTHESAI